MGDRGTPKTWRNMNGYRQPHLHVGQRRRREVLGQVPLQDRPGRRELHRRRGRRDRRRRTRTSTCGTCTTPSSAGDFPSWTLQVQVMPFEDAADYRFNPFDLTKVWPHGDYPLITRSAGWSSTATRTTTSPRSSRPRSSRPTWCRASARPRTRCCSGRLFSYPDTHRYRIGANYLQLPVNRPQSPVHSYNRDGAMRYENPGDPVYAPNSLRRSRSRPRALGGPTGYVRDGRDRAGGVHPARRGRRLRPAAARCTARC